jgi:hypothetical protein
LPERATSGALTERAARGSATLPAGVHDAVQDVGARIEAEDLVVELDVRGFGAVEGLNLDLHDLALLALGGFGAGSAEALLLAALMLAGNGRPRGAKP